MFNIRFKISKVFAPQEFMGSGEKLFKQDLIADLGDIRRLREINIPEETKTTSVLISLSGKKNQICNFEIGNSGYIVGEFYQFGRGVLYRLSGIRLDNPTYYEAYHQNGVKELPDDFGKSSFEFVLSHLHKIQNARESFDLVKFFIYISDKLEETLSHDEKGRLRVVTFYKSLPKMIYAVGADSNLFLYLLNNGLNILLLNDLFVRYQKIDEDVFSNLFDYLKAIEDIHYSFIGFNQVEIERIRLQRKFVLFESHEIRWLDFEGPVHTNESDFLASLSLGFIPDGIEFELSKVREEIFREKNESANTNNFTNRKNKDLSPNIEGKINLEKLSFEEYRELVELYDVEFELDELNAWHDEQKKLQDERDLHQFPPFDDDELDEWNGGYKPDY